MTIDKKIRVFLSSKCGGEYTVARKALQTMLEESGFCEVYAFETDYSSSNPVVSAYLNELADSDVIIVFIENKDGVPDPVQSEINRARELKKKILFIFCDQYERGATVLQNHLKEGLLEKYMICHEFADFPKNAYNSFFNDITKLYRQTNSEVVDTDDSNIGVTEEHIKLEFNQIKKEDLKKINSVRYHIRKMSGICFDKEMEFDELDKTFGDIFSVVIGKKTIGDVKLSLLDEYWNNIYSSDLEMVVKARKEALIKFLSGDYQATFDILEKTIETYKDKIPNWLLNDMAIDMRNTDMFISNEKGLLALSFKGQEILDEDKECIFNPLTDRFESEFYQELIKIELSNKIESVDTIQFGREDKAFDCLANSFVAAINCISITYILLVRSKISKLFITLSFQYRMHSLFVNAVKMLVLEGNEKELKNYFIKYGESTNLISSKDVNDIQLIVNNIPDEIKRIKVQAILFEFFAYYYDDDKFLNSKELFFAGIKKAITNGQVSVFSDVLRTLPLIDRRVNPDEIMDLVYLILESSFTRWHDESIKTIYNISTLSKLSKKGQKDLINKMKKWIADEKFRKNCPSLLDAIQKIRLSLGDKANSLDKLVVKYAYNYFLRPYSINVYEHTDKENSAYILDLIKSIRKQNETQGKNGSYCQYAYDDFSTIGNIIQNSTEKPIEFKYIRKVIEVIDETLRAQNQISEAKISSLRLLILIQMNYPRNKQVKKVLLGINDFELIRVKHEIVLQTRYTNSSLQVMWKLARMLVFEEKIDSFITDLLGCSEGEKIAILDSLCVLSKPTPHVVKDKLIGLIWPNLLMFEVSENKRICFFLAIIYSNLYDTSFSEKALNRLIVLLEDGSSKMKIGAISRLKAREAKGPIVEYIYQQGRVDNHFCVREVANR